MVALNTIIINSCPPKRSQKSLILKVWHAIPAKIHGLNFQLLISILKFNTWILQLNSKIYTLPLEFASLETFLHLPFSFLTQLFVWPCSRYIFNSLCQIIHCSQTMQFSTRRTNFYTASLLLFISFDDWTITLHLTEIRTLHSIFSTQLLNFCLRFSDHWSRQKKPLWGWEMATDRPPPPVILSIMLCEKRESIGNTLN